MKSCAKLHLNKQIISILFCWILSHHSAALAESTQQVNKQALIEIKVGVELSKFEQSAQEIAIAIEQGSIALQEMAKNPSLNHDQQQKITQTFQSIDQLAMTFQQSIKDLPAQVKSATPPIKAAMNDLFSNIQLAIILVLVALIIVLVVALIAIYYWILKPTSTMLIKTTSKLDEMASALQTTAIIVEKSSDQQVKILQENQRLFSTLKE